MIHIKAQKQFDMFNPYVAKRLAVLLMNTMQ